MDPTGRLALGASAEDALKVVRLLGQPASKAAQRVLVKLLAEGRGCGLGHLDIPAAVQFLQFDMVVTTKGGSGKSSWSDSLFSALGLLTGGGKTEANAAMAQVDVLPTWRSEHAASPAYSSWLGWGARRLWL
mgnify:CR=1 FL=1